MAFKRGKSKVKFEKNLKYIALLGLSFGLWSCSTTSPTPPTKPIIIPEPVKKETPIVSENIPIYPNAQLLFGEADFRLLENWQNINYKAARFAFLRTCDTIKNKSPENYLSNRAPYSGKIAQWLPVCQKANNADLDDKEFWETNFTPWRIGTNETLVGRLTSYFEPVINASPVKTDLYSEALYAKPDDLITLDLGVFEPKKRGTKLIGYIQNGRWQSYKERKDINETNTPVIAYATMGEALSLQIQGSGKLLFPDGKTMKAAFAAHNGRPFGSIARELINRGEMTASNASADNITKWFKTADSIKAREVINKNPRTVFFHLQSVQNPLEGPKGAASVPLEPGASVAIDPSFHAYGVPIFILAHSPRITNTANSNLSRLVIAQDTGGAITGAIRGDLYWGTGVEAGIAAGSINHDANWWVLLPKGLDPTLQ